MKPTFMSLPFDVPSANPVRLTLGLVFLALAEVAERLLAAIGYLPSS